MVTMATSWRKTGTPEQNPKASPPADPNKKMTGRFVKDMSVSDLEGVQGVHSNPHPQF